MWVVTDRGFFSAVDKGDREGFICVRARVREDLQRLCELGPMGAYADDIEESQLADYRYRIYARREDWSAALALLGHSIDYSNFKNAVEDRQGTDRAGIYGRVWSTLASLQQ